MKNISESKGNFFCSWMAGRL